MEIRELVTEDEQKRYEDLARKHFKNFNRIQKIYPEFVLGAFNPELMGYARNVVMQDSIEIANAGVTQERQGIYTELVRASIEKAKEYDVSRVIGKVPHPRMLERLGFEPVKHTPFGYLMQYQL